MYLRWNKRGGVNLDGRIFWISYGSVQALRKALDL